MDFCSRNGQLPPNGSDPVPPVNRIAALGRHGFGGCPDLAREKFLMDSVASEIDLGEQRETDDGAGPARPMGEETSWFFANPPPPSADDIRLHAWLAERLALLHYERHGLWQKFRRFLSGNRQIRWLVLHSLGEKAYPGKTQSDVRGVQVDRTMDAASSRETRFLPFQGRGCPSFGKG